MKPLSILVAGGAGYIGSHMVLALLEAGHRVVVLDDLSTGHRDLLPGGVFIQGSLGDAVLLEKVFAAYPLDAVMHFAAHSLVGESMTRPLAYYRNNLGATTVLLEAMLRHGVERFIFSSSAAVYGEPAQVPIPEEAPLAPTNPYGASKRAVEELLAWCATAHGLRAVSLRYFNAAGADPAGRLGERHDPETHLVPLVLQAAAGRRDAIQIFGTDYPTPDGTCIRDYVHVTDLAAAHLLALEALMDGAGGAVYNLGNSRGHSVREVIATARRVTGREIPEREAPRRPGDPAVLVAASDKARRELHWRPRFEGLETIIRTAWDWHRKNPRAVGPSGL